MYLRGLVLDYRVGWESTFLDAGSVHALLSTLLAPALALSGQTLPDVAALQALRLPQRRRAARPRRGSTSTRCSCCCWWCCRALLLALWAGWRARSLQANLPLPLGEPYFQRLLRQQRGGSTLVRVLAACATPDAAALAALRALLARVLGDGRAPADRAHRGLWQRGDAGRDGGRRRLAHRAVRPGRHARAGKPGPAAAGAGRSRRGAPVLLVDESAFVQRFGASSPRRAERRAGLAGTGRRPRAAQGVRRTALGRHCRRPRTRWPGRCKARRQHERVRPAACS